MSQQVFSISVFSAEALSAGGSATSPVYQTNSYRPIGNFSAYLAVTGDGTVKVDLYTSLDGTNYVLERNVFTGKTSGNTPLIEGFGTVVCTHFKLVATETGGVDTASVTLKMGIQ